MAPSSLTDKLAAERHILWWGSPIIKCYRASSRDVSGISSNQSVKQLQKSFYSGAPSYKFIMKRSMICWATPKSSYNSRKAQKRVYLLKTSLKSKPRLTKSWWAICIWGQRTGLWDRQPWIKTRQGLIYSLRCTYSQHRAKKQSESTWQVG